MIDYGKIKKEFDRDCDYLRKVGLDACPFCGGEAYPDSMMSPERVSHLIKCGSCGAQTRSIYRLKLAIDMWNRRTSR